jgi:3-deoxy-D-manno-octulosonic-acid transferase
MNGIDFAYASGLLVSAPFWLIKPSARRKVLKALRERMGDVPVRDSARPAVLIHAVSLGEMNATRALVEKLRIASPGTQFIVSSTTDTGYQRGIALYGAQKDVTVVRYPLDFSRAVDRVLDRLRPSIAVLMELEIWPNFIARCRRRGIPIILVNGRLTPYSYRRYRMIAPLSRAMLRGLSATCVQDEMYAGRFAKLGAPPASIRVTGTMKFDTAQVSDNVDGDTDLAAQVGLSRSDPLWVAGSTGPGEEEIILRIYRRLRKDYPALRLAIIPRKPDRFDEVAHMIESQGFELTRRSRNNARPNSIILGDTMGELRKFYSLASVVFVGRSIVDLGSRQHGSDMIEPAALAKPCITGPFTTNFADVMNKFRSAGAMREVGGEAELEQAIRTFLSDPPGAIKIGQRAQQVVIDQQGATDRHADIILELLKHPQWKEEA